MHLPKLRNMGLRKEGQAEEQRILDFGHPECDPPFADNSVTTSRYSLLSFLPVVSTISLCVQNGTNRGMDRFCVSYVWNAALFASTVS